MRKMKFMLSIIIFVAGFLVYFIIQQLIEENKITAGVNESYIGKTQPLGEFYTASKIKIEDSVKDISETDRVLVINKGDKIYSFNKNEVDTFAKIVEQLTQLEVTKIDSDNFYDQFILNATETKELNFFVHEQKDNGVIFEKNTFTIMIVDRKYLKITYNDTFEVVDQEELEVISDQIQSLLERHSNYN